MAFVSFLPATCWRDKLTTIFFFKKINFSEMLCCVVARVIPEASKDRSYLKRSAISNIISQKTRILRNNAARTSDITRLLSFPSPFTSSLPFDSVQVQVTCRSKKIKLSAVCSTAFTNPVFFYLPGTVAILVSNSHSTEFCIGNSATLNMNYLITLFNITLQVM